MNDVWFQTLCMVWLFDHENLRMTTNCFLYILTSYQGNTVAQSVECWTRNSDDPVSSPGDRTISTKRYPPSITSKDIILGYRRLVHLILCLCGEHFYMAGISYIDIIKFIWFHDPENIGITIKIMLLSLLWASIWNYIICNSIKGGHLENQYGWHHLHPYYQFDLILDAENMSIATKITSLSPLWSKIWTSIAYDSINGGHLEKSI